MCASRRVETKLARRNESKAAPTRVFCDRRSRLEQSGRIRGAFRVPTFKRTERTKSVHVGTRKMVTYA